MRAIRSNSSRSISPIRCRERSFELIERRARLQRRHRVDEIRHRFGLDQIDATVQKRAQRELARLGQPRAGGHGIFEDLPQHDRAAVRADFDDVFAGVGMGSGEVGGHHLVALHARERGVPRLQRSVELKQGGRDTRAPTRR